MPEQGKSFTKFNSMLFLPKSRKETEDRLVIVAFYTERAAPLILGTGENVVWGAGFFGGRFLPLVFES